MNYIIFDLEWNQSPEGKSGSDERMPFEIIERSTVSSGNPGLSGLVRRGFCFLYLGNAGSD